MPLNASPLRPGYAVLLGVLVVGAIAIMVTLSMLLLGWTAEQNGQYFSMTSQAMEAARACADIALGNLRNDLAYIGDQTIDLPTLNATCTIETIQGAGNTHRVICISGTAGRSTRRLEVTLEELFPEPVTSAYRELFPADTCP